MTWTLKKLELELRWDWTISRSSCAKKTNFLLSFESQNLKGLGEVAFNTRYAESEDLIESGFKKFQIELIGTEPVHNLCQSTNNFFCKEHKR